jgi:hypothetical protein
MDGAWWEKVFEDITSHLHRQDPDERMKWQKKHELLFSFQQQESEQPQSNLVTSRLLSLYIPSGSQ